MDKKDEFDFTKYDIYSCKIIYTILGVATAFPWVSLINCVHLISVNIYNDYKWGDTIIFIIEITPLFFSILYLIIGAARPYLLFYSFICYSIIALLCPLSLQFLPNISKSLILILTFIFTALMSNLLTITACLASLTPKIFNAYFGLGTGTSGLFSYFIFIISDSFIWSRNNSIPEISTQNLKNTFWLLLSISFFLSLIAAYLSFHLISKPCIYMRVKVYWNKLKKKESLLNQENDLKLSLISDQTDQDTMKLKFDNSNNILEELLPSRGIKAIVNDTWDILLATFLNASTTFCLYPLISPYAWRDTWVFTSLTGLFQIFNFIGRLFYLAFPSLNIPRKYFVQLVALRIIFYVISPLPIYEQVPYIFNGPWFQIVIIIIFAFTHGAFSTHVGIYGPSLVKRIREKGIVGSSVTTLIESGNGIGIIFSRLLKTVLLSFQ